MKTKTRKEKIKASTESELLLKRISQIAGHNKEHIAEFIKYVKLVSKRKSK